MNDPFFQVSLNGSLQHFVEEGMIVKKFEDGKVHISMDNLQPVAFGLVVHCSCTIQGAAIILDFDKNELMPAGSIKGMIQPDGKIIASGFLEGTEENHYAVTAYLHAYEDGYAVKGILGHGLERILFEAGLEIV